MTQRLKVVPSSVAYDIAGDYFQALRHIAPAAQMVRQQCSLIITPIMSLFPNKWCSFNILHISFNLTSYRIGEKRSSSLICQSRVFHAENSAHIFCIMMQLKVHIAVAD